MDNTLYIHTEITDGHIGKLRMQYEAEKNSFSHAFVDAFTKGIEELSAHEEVKVILLTGLPSVFCAGASIDTLRQLSNGMAKPIDIQLSRTLLDVPVPIIAAMEGHAIGGGFALGLCADIVILAEESRYGCSFMNMGFTPGMGITKLLNRYMSPAIACEMLYTGINKRGSELRGKTNFNHILSKKEVLPLAIQLAQAIAEKPKQAIVLLKRYLSLERRKLFEETHSIESMMHDITFNQKDILKNIEENYVR